MSSNGDSDKSEDAGEDGGVVSATVPTAVWSCPLKALKEKVVAFKRFRHEIVVHKRGFEERNDGKRECVRLKLSMATKIVKWTYTCYFGSMQFPIRSKIASKFYVISFEKVHFSSRSKIASIWI
jgi:hypothetical protein